MPVDIPKDSTTAAEACFQDDDTYVIETLNGKAAADLYFYENRNHQTEPGYVTIYTETEIYNGYKNSRRTF